MELHLLVAYVSGSSKLCRAARGDRVKSPGLRNYRQIVHRICIIHTPDPHLPRPHRRVALLPADAEVRIVPRMRAFP